MPEFSSLELFVEVARCRSFSRAADRAGVSQSAASQRVSHLEKTLGVRLLDRSSRPLRLTDAGRLLLEDGGPLAAAYRDLARRVAAMGHADAEPQAPTPGPLRVRGIYSAGIDWLGHIARRWAQDDPASEPWDLDFASHDAVRDALLHGRADLGVVSYPRGLADAWGQADTDQLAGEPEGRWAWATLREEPLALVCPPNHRFNREPAVAARHLRPQSLLMLGPTLPLGAAIAAYLRRHGAIDTAATPSAANSEGGFDNLDTLKSAILATDTPAILPRRCVAGEIQTHRLAAVPLRPAITRPLAVAYRLAPSPPTDDPPKPLAAAVAFLTQHAHDQAQAQQPPMPFPAAAAANPLNAATA